MMRYRPLRPSVFLGVVWAFLVAADIGATASTPAAQSRDPAPRQPALGDPDDAVVCAARDLIAAYVASMPAIYATDPRQLKIPVPSQNTPAFRISLGNWVNPDIFVNRLSITYKQAVSGDRCALKTLGAILVHEMAHSSTKDDKVASRAELAMLAAFIRLPSTGLEEQMCLMDRQAAVRRYAGLQ